MSRTLIDIDDEALAEVRQHLGTKSKKDTVNAALRDVLNMKARAEEFDFLASEDRLSELGPDEARRQAWR
jgi:Arc/MetJ family transcription regulator